MSRAVFNENTGNVEISENQLKKGLEFARKNKISGLKIVSSKLEGTRLDFSLLEGDDSIEALFISEDVLKKRMDLSPLYSMRRLNKLTIPYFREQIDFLKFKTLETLYLTGADAEIDTLSIRSLKSLLIVSSKNINCQFLSSLLNLDDLRISGGKIESLLGIEHLSKLRSVKIDHCARLKNVSSLIEINRLSDLYIEKCKNLADFSFLGKNESIENLFLSDLNSIDFVPGMKKLRNLKFWNLRDGNLDCLLTSKSLRFVDFYPEKKNYTYTKNEINELLKLRK